jgi:Heavy metal binding domain
MKNLIGIFVVLLFGVFAFAQENPVTDKKEMKECAKGCCSDHEMNSTMTMAYIDADSTHTKHHEMKSDSTMHGMHHEMKMKSDSMNTNMMVHKGEIDLQAIDKNKDGKVYQDMMDWNVISDEPGKCPLCGMTLKEVSLDKAKENLLKHDFKVKGNK